MNYAVAVTAREQAELVRIDDTEAPLGPREVGGPTLCTLTSPGTEIAGLYLGANFPSYPGYAAVFRADEIGAEISHVRPGDLLLCMGGHRSYQRVAVEDTALVPVGVAPEHAVLARLMGVSMTTLMTTTARPGDKVLIMGLGPVGYLAAQVFQRSGYRVMASDPDESRRSLASQAGISRVFPEVSADDPEFRDGAALVVECSGHEAAVLAACRAVRQRGEVVMVGVPWRRQTDLTAHELLHAVFHKYVVLRSGWEWELPNHSRGFQPHSIFGNYDTALAWLKESAIGIGDTLRLHGPQDAQRVYQGLLHRNLEGLFHVFDWRAMEKMGGTGVKTG